MSHEYTTGAKRSEKLPAYRYIPASALKAEAEAFALGAKNYETLNDGSPSPLTSNWRRGDVQFFLDAAEHLANHVREFNDRLLNLGLAYLREEDNEVLFDQRQQLIEDLGHARANTAMLIEWLDAGVAHKQLTNEASRVAIIGIKGEPGLRDQLLEDETTMEPVEVPVSALDTPGKFAELVKKFQKTFAPPEVK